MKSEGLVKNESMRRVNVDFPVSFHLWLESRAKINERSKRGEIKVITAEVMKLDPDLTGLDEKLYQGHTKSTKWNGVELPASCHLWLEERVKKSERTKAEELKLLCLWLQQRES